VAKAAAAQAAGRRQWAWEQHLLWMPLVEASAQGRHYVCLKHRS
jgi:hypothetical protein